MTRVDRLLENYSFRLIKQTLRVFCSWGQGQLWSLAIVMAWVSIYYGLVPTKQTHAAYVAELTPFGIVLIVYLMCQIAYAPYVLDREQRKLLKEKRDSGDRLLVFLETVRVEPTIQRNLDPKKPVIFNGS
jgi:hypothetical protein